MIKTFIPRLVIKKIPFLDGFCQVFNLLSHLSPPQEGIRNILTSPGGEHVHHTLKYEGYNLKEISVKTGCTPQLIRRELQVMEADSLVHFGVGCRD